MFVDVGWIRLAQDRFPWWVAVNTAVNHLYGFIKGDEFSDIVYGHQDPKEGSSAWRSWIRYSQSWKYKAGKVGIT